MCLFHRPDSPSTPHHTVLRRARFVCLAHAYDDPSTHPHTWYRSWTLSWVSTKFLHLYPMLSFDALLLWVTPRWYTYYFPARWNAIQRSIIFHSSLSQVDRPVLPVAELHFHQLVAIFSFCDLYLLLHRCCIRFPFHYYIKMLFII